MSVTQGGQDDGLELVDINLMEEGDETVPIEQPVSEVVANREVAGKPADTLIPPQCPVVVLFNSKSGGQEGVKVRKAMVAILGEENVYDLATCNPKEVLLGLRGIPGVRLLVCGGDGTMGWIFAVIEDVQEQPGEFPVAMMPLGTGNDLSRSFGWGRTFSKRMLKQSFIDKVQNAKTYPLDRWEVCVIPNEPPLSEKDFKPLKLPPTFTLHRYRKEEGQQVAARENLSEGELGVVATEEDLNISSCEKTKSEQIKGEQDGNLHDTVKFVAHSSINVASSENAMIEGTSTPGEGNDSSPTVGLQQLRHYPPHLERSPSMKFYKGAWMSYDGVFQNYISIGVDAVAAYAFHQHREAHPELFTGPIRNKIWYVRKGMIASGGIPCFQKPPSRLCSFIELKVRRPQSQEWEVIPLHKSLRGLIILNIQLYGGGVNMLDKGCMSCCAKPSFTPPQYDDKVLEIVGVTTIIGEGCILSCNKLGFSARQIVQAEELSIRIRKNTHMQADGEPWEQLNSFVHIRHRGSSTCLVPLSKRATRRLKAK